MGLLMKRFILMCTVLVCNALFLSTFANAQSNTNSWEQWLISQIAKHPDMLAAKESFRSVSAMADANEQPLYNPEFTTDFERLGSENNYQVGLEQTIDWRKKLDTNKQKADSMRRSAQTLYHLEYLDKTSSAISALIEWSFANKTISITHAQEKQLTDLLDLVKKRKDAGDLGVIDAELAFLSLSQQLVQVAEADAALQITEARVRELLNDWEPSEGGIPEEFWLSRPKNGNAQRLLSHPAVSSAKAQWLELREEAVVTRLATKPDPTVGFSVGRDEGENKAELSFSIPLNIRNDFSAETRAAEYAAIEAEARFQAIYRQQQFMLQGAETAWQRYDQQYRRWQKEVQARVENISELLDRQWSSGDLSTPDYLQALSQRSESILAGIELEKQTILALAGVYQIAGSLIDTTTIKELN